ncbi:MAG: ACT domain-containing protein [Spirochaetes bacterium]|nr:ACT domain-containing protein [Spirochaetota bacterium]
MRVTQISIFLENRKGRLHDVCLLLGENNINIMALTIAETENFGVLRIVVNKPDQAIKLLKSNSFAANLTDVVVVEVEDKPGGLAKILKILNNNDINIEYIHAFFKKHSDKAFMVFRFDEPDSAIKVLIENNVNIIDKNKILEL